MVMRVLAEGEGDGADIAVFACDADGAVASEEAGVTRRRVSWFSAAVSWEQQSDTWNAISNRTQPTTKPACGRRHERKMVDTGYRFLARIYRPSS